MSTAEYWIGHLKLLPHPEGGFYREVYRSPDKIPSHGLPKHFGGERNFATAIYFLLRSQDKSLFHRIKSDELWHFYAGTSLSIFVLNDQGLKIYKLGTNPEKEESLQVVIPANHWFGAMVDNINSFTLAGCTVSPGFDFNDFEMADRNSLIKLFPSFAPIIEQLTPVPGSIYSSHT